MADLDGDEPAPSVHDLCSELAVLLVKQNAGMQSVEVETVVLTGVPYAVRMTVRLAIEA